jgi:P-type Cu+ transporter
MSALSSAFSGLWYKDASATTPGKVELPLMKDEPLGSPMGKTEKCELRIEGMTCGSCVEVSFPTTQSPLRLPTQALNLFQSIEGMLRSQPGIHSVKVALLAERGVVEFDPVQWTTEKVINVSFHLILSGSGA